MAKSTKKKRPVPRDPLIARAKKTLKPTKPRKAKQRGKPARAASLRRRRSRRRRVRRRRWRSGPPAPCWTGCGRW